MEVVSAKYTALGEECFSKRNSEMTLHFGDKDFENNMQ